MLNENHLTVYGIPPVLEVLQRSATAGSIATAVPTDRCVSEMFFLPMYRTAEPVGGYTASLDIIVESKRPGKTENSTSKIGMKKTKKTTQL
jgi:hypothetical protein